MGVLTACPHEDLVPLMDILLILGGRMTIDSVASTWSYCIGCPTLMLIMMPVFLECIGFISLPSSPVAETITEGCKAGVFDVSNYLFA